MFETVKTRSPGFSFAEGQYYLRSPGEKCRAGHEIRNFDVCNKAARVATNPSIDFFVDEGDFRQARDAVKPKAADTEHDWFFLMLDLRI